MAVFKGFTLLKVRHYCSQKDYTQAGDLALGLLGVTGVHLGRAFPDRAREKTKARRGRSSAAQTETKA